MSAATRLPQGLERPKLRVHDLCLSFHENGAQRQILDHINLTVQSGEFVCIVGPSPI
jgi:ABC-type nitrate/sulfonate/bicarbonate transport system ATPase subunit